MEKHDIKKVIAQNLANIRKERGIQQKELGISLGFEEAHAQTRISQYETGKRSPNKATLQRIADLMGVEINYFFHSGQAQKKPAIYPTTEMEKELHLLCEDSRKYGIDNVRAIRKMLPHIFGRKSK